MGKGDFLNINLEPNQIIEEALAALDRYLKQADLVIMVDPEDAGVLTDSLCTSEALEKTTRCVMVISTEECSKMPDRHIFLTVTDAKIKLFEQIYRMYEASNKLLLYTRKANYGTMWNYVDNGVITEEEMLEAMLL